MKKFITLLFISLFVSQINAAMMPVDLNVASGEVAISSYDHCQETASIGHIEEGKSSANAGASHYCCAVVAILITPPDFFAPKQPETYTHINTELLASNITESIYKPPRTYL
ncbi:hypothetical protein ICN11_08460 [Polynucleobacter sp. 78F-HAINBA]|uniref:hypothetical protein n=1 Tax=Polynucleobacter sp. 78F-HAINBA TaxID=2689099 RepID=UPI001C0D025E|nr:hypothetical protein [Polynucleobacter sp. 78F-HAINBA]MBU3592046.1 hypothetical protein [Polynucleobacter sp. 78F-HAINBA]